LYFSEIPESQSQPPAAPLSSICQMHRSKINARLLLMGGGHDGLLWLHFNLADARALHWLSAAGLKIPVQARALLLSKDTYQQLHTTDDSVYAVISDLLRDIAESTEETGYLRFVMTRAAAGQRPASCALRRRRHPPRA
jgi:zinc transporter